MATADTSPNIRRALQRLLAADGYKGSIDGSFGPQTQAALDLASAQSAISRKSANAGPWPPIRR
ncbi:peptidoglycan-binding domain-containing protein [Devosia nitrariae]|uniref:peptidoglycan-binding domain-containing protein n=1 Tax=Devosia nitrariae TaxID=2071872 RepID=UPI0035EAAC4F